ncbi:CMRF35-like molecule 3 [Silurus asotus]|uniref:CMRF35-like molecule 3 n=1 Tax=Silurus asotus TaxID=30991 RepID=A0AAD5AHE8_SILAS|nr:CMRF35-like molecule 3 [Silurus asotus]
MLIPNHNTNMSQGVTNIDAGIVLNGINIRTASAIRNARVIRGKRTKQFFIRPEKKLSLKIKIFLLFTFCLIAAGSDAVTTVTGYRGRSVQIKCHYESGYEKNNKYLCRGECPPWPAIKDIPVQSGSPAEDIRFSLYDDTTAKIFTITITDLRAEDANTYWCVVQQKGKNIYTKLQLLVKTDDSANSTASPITRFTSTSLSVHAEITRTSSSSTITAANLLNDAKDPTIASAPQTGSDAVTKVTGYRGRSVQIKCSYESGYEKNNKYLCRGECPGWPAIKDIPVQSGSPAEDTRFSLYDDTTAKIFTVTITDLRAEDANTYWCVVEQTGPNIYTKLQLLVKPDDSANSTASPTTRFTSTSLSVHAEITHTSSSSTITAANLLNDAKDPTIASAPQKFPTSAFIIAVSVLLELLLIAILFTFKLQRKKKTMTQEFPTSAFIIAVSVLLELLLIAILFTFKLQRKKKTMTQGHDLITVSYFTSDQVPCPVSENEEVSNSLYSAVQLPSAPSEIYSNTGLPTIPSDPSPPVYAALKRPAHQDVYSTAQLPSDSSVSAAQSSDIKSGESIKYATVSFNNSSNGAAPKLISKNQNISCDYDSVSITE